MVDIWDPLHGDGCPRGPWQQPLPSHTQQQVCTRVALVMWTSGHIARAGHTTTLPRQRGPVFRPKICLLYYGIVSTVHSLWQLHLDIEDLTFFVFFLVPEAL